jgi:pantetheine-phosphate adenylyltransferase
MTVCVYAGTFDPFTRGHLSVVLQGCRLFSHVRILVADNPSKHPVFSSRERIKIIESYIGSMPHVSVDATTGYVVRYAENIGASVLLRGVRNETDANAEMNLAIENLKLAPHIQTVLLPSDPATSTVSSTLIKQKMESSSDFEDMKDLLTVEAYFALRQARERITEMKKNGHA